MIERSRLTPILVVGIMGVVVASPWLAAIARERPVTGGVAIEELNPRKPGKSWRVEGKLGRDVIALFAEHQGCYLSRTLGAR